jgi:hypothetical protein
MLFLARSGVMKVWMPSWVWLGIIWKITCKSILNLCTNNVSANDMKEGKWSMPKLGGPCGIIMGVFLIAIFCKGLINGQCFWTKYLGVTLAGTLFHMCKSGQFYPNPTWVILLRFVDVRRAASIWKTWWIPMISRWRTSPMSSLILCQGLQYDVF